MCGAGSSASCAFSKAGRWGARSFAQRTCQPFARSFSWVCRTDSTSAERQPDREMRLSHAGVNKRDEEQQNPGGPSQRQTHSTDPILTLRGKQWSPIARSAVYGYLNLLLRSQASSSAILVIPNPLQVTVHGPPML